MIIPENAVNVAGYAIGTDYRSSLTFPREVAEVALSAALPYLRRAILEDLIAKAEAEQEQHRADRSGRGAVAAVVAEWLRAELNPTEK